MNLLAALLSFIFSRMYLTRIAGIEPYLSPVADVLDVLEMYLTRIAGIEPEGPAKLPKQIGDVSYPHSGN